MGASLNNGGGKRGKGRFARGRYTPMAEINVTPFVDVMLVLLIIFMVAAPMLTVGVPLELPKTAAAALPTEQEEPLTISITPEGGIAIQNTAVSDAELIPKLTAIAAERTSNKVDRLNSRYDTFQEEFSQILQRQSHVEDNG